MAGKYRKENKKQIGRTETKEQDERFKPKHINGHIKCEWPLYDFI